MNRFQKRWLISLVVFLLFTCLAVFIGISVSHMTAPAKSGKDSETAETKEGTPPETTENTTPEETTSETAPEADDSRESESGSERETEPSSPSYENTASPIKVLKPEALDLIRETCDTTVMTYSLGTEKDAENRPVNCLEYESAFSAISDKITVFNSHDNSRKELSLCFVATQEYNTNTAYILNKLTDKNIRATFFINHRFAAENPDLVKRMISSGHEIGSLGASSPDEGLAAYALEDQMADMLYLQRYMEENFDYSMTSFYFRGDVYSEASLKMASDMGYHVRYYTMEYDDVSSSKAIDSEAMLNEIIANLHPSASLLLHNANPATLIMLPNLANYLKDEGWTITKLH
ncbi:MAG: polysaccharide deacetylase family protein [Lachnospiraceae bacterium]|nr:polysaccharide deacetylase family protein [Lachnospiraceae bacterium]